jgi:Arc/MetJ-type ribon-helix-helix transcriptional regulator
MPLTVRLGAKAERTLNALAKRHRLSRSEVVREALVRYEASEGQAAGGSRPYDAWLDVIGLVNLAVRDPRRTTGEQFATSLRASRRARAAR